MKRPVREHRLVLKAITLLDRAFTWDSCLYLSSDYRHFGTRLTHWGLPCSTQKHSMCTALMIWLQKNAYLNNTRPDIHRPKYICKKISNYGITDCPRKEYEMIKFLRRAVQASARSMLSQSTPTFTTLESTCEVTPLRRLRGSPGET